MFDDRQVHTSLPTDYSSSTCKRDAATHATLLRIFTYTYTAHDDQLSSGYFHQVVEWNIATNKRLPLRLQ